MTDGQAQNRPPAKPAERGNTWKQRIRDKGFKKRRVLIPAECEPESRAIEKAMRAPDAAHDDREETT